MRKSVFTALLAVVLLCSCGRTQKYVVGFYNLENLFDTVDDPAVNDEEFLPEGRNHWTQDKYEVKLRNIASVIEAMKEETGVFHTVLGVSEVENAGVLEDLVDEPGIAPAGYEIVHYDSPDRRGIDVALLYRPDQFELLDSEAIPFSFDDTEVDITLSPEEQADFRTRDILMARGLLGGEQFAFYVAHLPSRVGGKGGDLRSLGAEIIYKHSQALMQEFPGIKIVVMGDMNDNPTDVSMTEWMHAEEDIDEVDSRAGYFSPFTQLLEDGYGSLEYRGEWNIYDIILVNYDLAAAPDGGLHILETGDEGYYGRVFSRPFMVQQSGRFAGTPFRSFSYGEFIGGYSDHYPTYIVIGR